VGVAGGVLRWISTSSHFEEMVKGLVSTADLAYFAVMIGTFLLLTKAAVESVRWR
jgi:ABC-2 type transport system permease protein